MADPLALPFPEKLRDISAKQDARAKEVRERRAAQVQERSASLGTAERSHAAALIQRNYRGYRQRREMQGFGLDPSTRWLEVHFS